MTDALARYRVPDTRKNALDRYTQADDFDLGALARYLGLESYWDRQGRMAQQGLQMAEQGAQAVRGGDFSGLGGALLGPVAYLSSPINALFPERSEVDAATDVPSWSKPLIAGGLETMAVMAPGPKARGLGRGMASLADDATDAERAALAGRLEAEAAQTGTSAVPVSRDQALTNLVEAPPLAQRIKSGWGDFDATRSWESELNSLSGEQVAALMREIGLKPGSTKRNNITAILGASSQAGRDAQMAERIRRGQ